MYTNVSADSPASTLVDVIEFKWLFAGEGVHLHVERMLSDGAYASRALAQALESGSPVLRAASERLRIRLLRA